jgi:hypothetical protein
MALELSVDSIENVAEAFRPLYVEKDGKFKLDVNLPEPEDTSGLKTALQKERKAREAAEKQTKSWQKLGKTESEIEELLATQAEAEADKAAKAGEWDKLRAQMNEKHAIDLKAKEETISAMRKRLEAELVDAKAVAAIAAAKGVPELLLPHVQRHVKVSEDFNVMVVDAKGDPRVNGKGDPLSIPDLIEEMKANEIYGRAFEASGQSGSGTRPGNNGGGSPQITRRSEFKSEKERAAFVDAFGMDVYKALPL